MANSHNFKSQAGNLSECKMNLEKCMLAKSNQIKISIKPQYWKTGLLADYQFRTSGCWMQRYTYLNVTILKRKIGTKGFPPLDN